MPRLPVVSAAEALKAALSLNYSFLRQKGSHIILKNAKGKLLVIPNHKRLKKGTLLQIIKALGVTKEDFISLL